MKGRLWKWIKISLVVVLSIFLILVSLPKERRFFDSDTGITISVPRFPLIFLLGLDQVGRKGILKYGEKIKTLDKTQIEISTSLIKTWLRKYPPQIFRGNIEKIYVVKAIDDWKGLSHKNEVVISIGSRLETGDTKDVERTFHHEIGHIFYRNYQDLFGRRDWVRTNLDDFAYGDDMDDGAYDAPETNDTFIANGFVRKFSTRNIREDFSDVTASVFSGDTETWKVLNKGERLRTKVNLVISFYNKIDTAFTERYFLNLK